MDTNTAKMIINDGWQSEIPNSEPVKVHRHIANWADDVDDDTTPAKEVIAPVKPPAKRNDGFTPVVNKRRIQRAGHSRYVVTGRHVALTPTATAPPPDNYEICIFNLLCPNPKCSKLHHKDRDVTKIVIDPRREHCVFALNGKECTFGACTMNHDVACPSGAECTVECILVHPEGHNCRNTKCQRGADCDDTQCLGVHPDGWELPLCSFNPFCTRVGKPGEKPVCDRRHTPDNGKLRMLRGFCNFKTNSIPCKHGEECPYENPSEYPCREGKGCRYLKKGQCGFYH